MRSEFQRFHRATSSDDNLWQMLSANATRDLMNALNTSVARRRPMKSLERSLSRTYTKSYIALVAGLRFSCSKPYHGKRHKTT